jgi:hypothetical protein
MKKIILTMAVVFTATFTNAQSNQKGTIHVNVMGGFLTGSATDKSDLAGSTEEKFSATGAQFGANFQYGIAESFSAGIGLEFGSAVLTPKDLNSYSSSYFFEDTTISTFKIILSGRYYFLNKEKFNLFASPSIGYTSGKDSTTAVLGTGFGVSTKYSGLNFGLNAGGNYYFTDHVGVILNLGYEGNSLKSTASEAGFPDETGKSSFGGIKVMAGLALKF